MFLIMPSAKIAQMAAPLNKGAARAVDNKYLSNIRTVVEIQNIFTEMFHNALCQNCTNGSDPPNEGAARAVDKKS